MLLNNKVVIVSGIGPGLGTELALEVARQGGKLAIAGRTLKKLDSAASAVAELGLNTELIKVQADITDPLHCQQLVEQTVKAFGRIDCLLNSAFNPGGADLIEHANLPAWRQAMEVNLFGTMNLSLAVIPQMKLQGGGSIVNVNTMVTRKPLVSQAGYAASKAALTAATQHMALELGQYNIRVNSTYMGWMWGASVKSYFNYQSKITGTPLIELKAQVEKNIPLGRMPTDTDCAKSVIFLASDYACAITGACLDVNGGEYLPR